MPVYRDSRAGREEEEINTRGVKADPKCAWGLSTRVPPMARRPGVSFLITLPRMLFPTKLAANKPKVA